MKFSELKGRPVINLEDASKIGEVEDLIIEPGSHRIVAAKVRTGMFHAAQIIPVADVKNVGADAVTVSVSDSPGNSPADTADPVIQSETGLPGTGGKAPENSQPTIEITSILGNKVVTDAGTMAGELRDVLFDWSNLTITGYEVHEGGLFGKAQEFAATPEVRYGDKLITIPAQLLSRPN
jgi:uncharacterized protein YrrD